MNFKQLPYWIKGGIVAGVLSFIIAFYYILYNGLRSDVLTAIYAPGLSALFMSKGGLFSGNHLSLFEEFFAITLNGFVYGVIIGWLYGKIKNRKTRAIPLS
jgi:hypothetical protein